MAERYEFSLRPLSDESAEGAFRVHLTTNDLTSLALKTGQLCQLKTPGGATGVAIVWRTKDSGTKKGIAKVTRFLKDAYGFQFQEPIYIEPGGRWQRVDRVVIRDFESKEGNPIDQTEYELLARCTLYRLKAIHPGLKFKVSPRESQERHFSIQKIEPVSQGEESPCLYAFSPETQMEFTEDPISNAQQETYRDPLRIQETAIGGLSHQIQQINRYLQILESGQMSQFPSLGLQMGLLLHGPQGVGKSMLLDKISEAPWRKAVRIVSPVNKSIVNNAFKEALGHQPSVVILDDLDNLVGSQEPSGSSRNHVASMLTQEIDGLRGQRVLVIGATRYLFAVHSSLRVSHRLSRELEIPVPNVQARKDILKVLNPEFVGPDLLEKVGEETHGYVGGDLYGLMKEAVFSAMGRQLEKHKLSDSSQVDGADAMKEVQGDASAGDLGLTAEDFDIAKRFVRPSAMREVFLETPNVKWSNIAGSEEVKEQLKRITEWPFKRAKGMEHFRVGVQKGLLLYGPPGCSKTLTAKALAGEGKLNFLSVKGAELISMYVGESERAIREVFRRARAASPSILFFDEIDSIAAARDSSSHTGGLNVLTTLLTEMDGFEDLKDVLVLAATNKPEVLDPALMRPGRFDGKLYIGPPGHIARRQLFEMNSRKEVWHENVDIEMLAAKTDGHSGAEIVRICQKAAELALADSPDDTGFIWQTHFEQALKSVPPQITSQVREKFEKWAQTLA